MKIQFRKIVAAFLIAAVTVSGTGISVSAADGGTGCIPALLCKVKKYFEGSSGSVEISSERILVSTENPSQIRKKDTVIGNYEGLYLISCDSEKEAESACRYYSSRGLSAQQDSAVYAAEERTIPLTGIKTLSGSPSVSEELQDKNPLATLQDMVSGESTTAAGDKEERDGQPLIALIDTGVSGASITEAVSVIDEKISGGSHAAKMKEAICSQNRKAKILSIRALNNQGYGTVSSVVAALEYAMDKNADIINLSLYAKNTEENEVLLSEIEKAVSAGITVVGAAGNAGEDAGGYVPGASERAYIIGACNEDGSRQKNSNYGFTVDYYVKAESTSTAAALFTGYLTANGITRVKKFPLLVQNVTEPETEKKDSSRDRQLPVEKTKKVTVRYTSTDGSENNLSAAHAFDHERLEDRRVLVMEDSLPVYREENGNYMVYADTMFKNGTAAGDFLDWEFSDFSGNKWKDISLDRKTGAAEIPKEDFSDSSILLKILVPVKKDHNCSDVRIEIQDPDGTAIKKSVQSYAWHDNPVFRLDGNLEADQIRIYLNGNREPLSEKEYSYSDSTGELIIGKPAAVISDVMVQMDREHAAAFMAALENSQEGKIEIEALKWYSYAEEGLAPAGSKGGTNRYQAAYENKKYNTYCIQPANRTPGSGTYRIEKIPSEELAQTIYYGNEVIEKYWPGEYNTSQKWILVHLAAGYVFCMNADSRYHDMDDFDWTDPDSQENIDRDLRNFSWGGVYEKVKKRVMQIIAHCYFDYDRIPDGTLNFIYADNEDEIDGRDQDGVSVLETENDVYLSKGGKRQRTCVIKLNAGKAQSLSVKIPEGMGYYNQTTKEKIDMADGGTATIHGGDRFFFFADLTFEGTWSSGVLKGNKRELAAEVYKVYTGNEVQNLAFVDSHKDEVETALKIRWKGKKVNSLRILKTDAEISEDSAEEGAYLQTLDSVKGTQKLKGAEFTVLYAGEYTFTEYSVSAEEGNNDKKGNSDNSGQPVYRNLAPDTSEKRHLTLEQMKSLQEENGVVHNLQVAKGKIVNPDNPAKTIDVDMRVDIYRDGDKIKWKKTGGTESVKLSNVISGFFKTVTTDENGIADTDGLGQLKNGTLLVYETRPPKGYLLKNTEESGRKIGGSLSGAGGSEETAASVILKRKNGEEYEVPAFYTAMIGNTSVTVNICCSDYLIRGDFNLKKTDGDGNGIQAKFRLANNETGQSCVFETDRNGNYSTRNAGEEERKKLYEAFSLLSNGEKATAFEDENRSSGTLPYGTYTLTELSTENGVQLLASPVTLTIPISMSDGEREKARAKGQLEEANAVYDAENGITYYTSQSISIENDSVTTLPDSGGKSLFWLVPMAVGAILGGWFLAHWRKKEKMRE